jgi:hypothetical protein
LLAQGRWFSPGTPASSITKTGRHDIAEILLKVALNTKNLNSNSTILSFLAHLAKGNVSFCHYLAVVRRLSSVVCRPLTFHILIFSSETPQPNEPKLDRKHL